MCYRAYLVIACSYFFLLRADGQASGYPFRHITQLDGLINNHVLCMAQDQRGFIWIGTQAGLQRYDGSRFLPFRGELNPENKSLLDVSKLITGETIQWVVVNGRLKKIDLLAHRIDSLTGDDIRKDIAGKQIFTDQENRSWVFGQSVAYFRAGPSAAWTPINALLTRDPYGRQIWAVTREGLVLFDLPSGQVYSGKHNPRGYPVLGTSTGARGIMMDSRNNLWINTWKETFYKYNVVTKKTKAYSLSTIRRNNHIPDKGIQMTVNAVFEDSHRHIWLATTNAGLLQYDEAQDRFRCIQARNDDSRGLQYNYEIICIFQDRDDNIWLGTDEGINIFNPYHSNFTAIRHEEGRAATLPKREITGFIETGQGDILVGTWGGGITLYDHQWNCKRTITFAGAYENNLVWNFMQKEDGKIWIGCQHGYLHVYDPSSGSVHTVNPTALQHSTVMCMGKDRNGNILFGLFNGKIALWKKGVDSFFAYDDSARVSQDHPPASPESFTPVHHIFFDKAGNCWAATENGLKRFDVETRSFTGIYDPGRNRPHSIQGIEELDDSTLIVGILNGGLALFNKRTGQFAASPVANLQAATVYAIKKDAQGNFWFTADYDLYKFDPRQQKCIRCNTEPGTINSSFYSSLFYPLKDGRWLTATLTEVLCFSPDSLDRRGSGLLPVEITGLKLFDNRLFIDSFLVKKQPLRLSYTQNFITFEFATLHFSHLRQIKYYYRLSAVDKDWVNAETGGTASYTNLLPGDYTFSVRAEDGSDKSQVTSFPFIISPPLWQTWWFRAACILLTGCAIYWLVKKRIGAVRKEAALKQQIAATEMMALRAQMNPHFIFNCINSIDALIQSNDKYLATVYLNKFARLIRNILDSSRQNTVPLAKDLETLRLYIELEQFRNDNLFSYEIIADNHLLQDDYRVPPLIIQPYVENAILHGLRYRPDRRGRLFISVCHQPGHLKYIVEDNGIGRQAHSAIVPPKGERSYGIRMTNDRVRLFNNESEASVEITDLLENGMPAGTKVEVHLKMQ
jgi:ligand-binding sensor domain-containing protein